MSLEAVLVVVALVRSHDDFDVQMGAEFLGPFFPDCKRCANL